MNSYFVCYGSNLRETRLTISGLQRRFPRLTFYEQSSPRPFMVCVRGLTAAHSLEAIYSAVHGVRAAQLRSA